MLPKPITNFAVSPFMCISGSRAQHMHFPIAHSPAASSAQTREVRADGVEKLERSFSIHGVDLSCQPVQEVIKLAAPPQDVIDSFPEAVMTALGFTSKADLQSRGEFYRLVGGNHRNAALRNLMLKAKPDPKFADLSMMVPALEYAGTITPLEEVLLSEKSNLVKAAQVELLIVLHVTYLTIPRLNKLPTMRSSWPRSSERP